MNNKFLWGSATASYQCEGGWNEDDKVESMWDRYLHDNHLENGDVASDHYHHFKEDIKMMADGGQNAYRFSISWPRIIKNKAGEVNPKGIAFYNELIDECIKNNIEPFVTCYHWDLPQYLEEDGGWLNKETVYAFQKYCEVLFKEFGDRVTYWTTFNEPKWFIFSGYMSGNYPPCHVNQVQEVITACFNVMYASSLAIKSYRQMNLKGQIGLVASYQTIYASSDSDEYKQAIRNADNYCNNWQVETAALGEFPKDMVEKLKGQGYDLSFASKDELEIIKNYTVDFVGLNYYSPQYVMPYQKGETIVKFNNQGSKYKGNLHTVVKEWFEIDDEFMNNLPHNPWGMVIYPQGLYDAIKNCASLNVPMYITENGLGMYEDINQECIHDIDRIDYIKNHVKSMLEAVFDGYDVNGYFVWSTFDLYSWKNGHEKRYGLVGVDFDNDCKRKPKESYYWYRDEILNNWEDLKND
ncbi:MAG: glycoside hydrolase family 1 protein [Traorella sp.]